MSSEIESEPPKKILSTARLTLRTWTMDDISSGLAIWGNPGVMRFVGSGKGLDSIQVQRSIEAGIKHQEDHGFQHWAVIENASGKVIGACGFNCTEQVGEIELVFHFEKSSWNKGFATEAAFACVQFAKKNMKPEKIIASCHPENEASKSVLKKAGLRFVRNQWFEDTQQEESCFEIAVVDSDKLS